MYMLVIQRGENLYKEVSKKLNRARECINMPRIELIKRGGKRIHVGRG